MTPKITDWEDTMTPKEAAWCLNEIEKEIDSWDIYNVTDFRAARAWKKTQIKRFKRLRSC